MSSHAETRRFYAEWSDYIERFLAGRSVLAAALFPEKPAQMWFGYEYSVPVLQGIAEWSSSRMTPEALGRSQRKLLAPATRLHFASALWSSCFGVLGARLAGETVDAERTVRALDFWRKAYQGYTGTATAGPPEGVRQPDQRILEPEQVAELMDRLRPVGDLDFQRVGGAITNYTWLMECESRQGTSSHGPYDTGQDTSLLVREFGDLSGAWYPWLRDAAVKTTGRVALAIELASVDIDFDAFGTARLTPDDYADHVRRVAVVTSGGAADDPVADLRRLQAEIKSAHAALYVETASWTMRQRFEAGALSYARLWAAFVEAAGGDRDDVERLVRAPLAAAGRDHLDRHLASDVEAAIWQRVTKPDRGALLAPVLAVIDETAQVREIHA